MILEGSISVKAALAGGHRGAAAAERLGGAGLDLDEDEQASGAVALFGALQHEVDLVPSHADAAADDAQSVVLRLLFAEQFALRLPLAPEPLPRGRAARVVRFALRADIGRNPERRFGNAAGLAIRFLKAKLSVFE